MKLFIIPMLILAGLVLSEELDMAKVLEEARARIKDEQLISFKAGAQSSKFAFQKSTKMSRFMDDRNALYRTARDILIKRGMDASNASDFVTHQMKVESRMMDKAVKQWSRAGRRATLPRLAPVIKDVCDGVAPKCDPDKPFRTYDGRCNNVKKGKELWGATHIPMRRILNRVKQDLTQIYTYDETVAPPRPLPHKVPVRYASSRGPGCKCIPGCHTGLWSVPNARMVSAAFHRDLDVPDTLATNMLPQFGELLRNDITLIPETVVKPSCCYCHSTWNCFTIAIPKHDYFFSKLPVKQDCIDFTRSSVFCQSKVSGREPMNAVTSFVDGSQFYGSDEDTARSLRGPNGTMLVDKYNLLPFGKDNERLAGDVRATYLPGIAAMQTLFVREHNRIVKELKSLKILRDCDLIYQNARRIVAATWQNIVFGEYLPIVLGPEAIRTYDLNVSHCSKHYPDIDPSIINSFATAAIRFDHSMVQGFPKLFATNDTSKPKGKYSLGGNFFNLTFYEANKGKGMEEILQGLTLQPAQALDRYVTSQLTNHLVLEKGKKATGDLVAMNLQRARDHGIPNFFYFAKFFNNSYETDCWKYRPESFDKRLWSKLWYLYRHPKDIELFVGGSIQKPVKGGLVGDVFSKIIGQQFHNLKFGDRFFFTHKNEKRGFTKEAKDEIRKRTLADVICDNTDISMMPLSVFKLVGPTNPITNCSKRSKLDIKKINLIKTF